MTVIVFLHALGAVCCFVAHGAGWPRGLGSGLAAATAAVVLLPTFAALPG